MPVSGEVFCRGFLDTGHPQLTMVPSILSYCLMTWMIWGTPHDSENLYVNPDIGSAFQLVAGS